MLDTVPYYYIDTVFDSSLESNGMLIALKRTCVNTLREGSSQEITGLDTCGSNAWLWVLLRGHM